MASYLQVEKEVGGAGEAGREDNELTWAVWSLRASLVGWILWSGPQKGRVNRGVQVGVICMAGGRVSRQEALCWGTTQGREQDRNGKPSRVIAVSQEAGKDFQKER